MRANPYIRIPFAEMVLREKNNTQKLSPSSSASVQDASEVQNRRLRHKTVEDEKKDIISHLKYSLGIYFFQILCTSPSLQAGFIPLFFLTTPSPLNMFKKYILKKSRPH